MGWEWMRVGWEWMRWDGMDEHGMGVDEMGWEWMQMGWEWMADGMGVDGRWDGSG